MRILGLLAAGSLLAGLQAGPITYNTVLSGANETPPTVSPATGTATVTIDTVTNMLTVSVTFSGLIGGTAAAAHIHCCTPPGTNVGVAIPFTSFPPATSGTYSPTAFDLTLAGTYTVTFLTASGGTAPGAEAALAAGLASGRAYVNIHDAQFPGGEIRGFLTPEPSSAMLLGAGVLAIGLLKRRRR